MAYQIGFQQVEFTPPAGMWMGGYAPMRTATGMADPLWMKGFVITNSSTKEAIACITYDLVAIDQLLLDELKRQLLITCPDWDVQVFLTATHTHSGPAGTLDTHPAYKQTWTPIFGESDEALLTDLVKKSMLLIQHCLKNQEPFRYQKGVSILEGIATDRNDARKPGDSRLGKVLIETTSGKQLLLWHFSCHPTVLSASNRFYSADLPGAVAHELVEFDQVMFFNGNAGNISTRFTRSDSTFEEMIRFGERIAAELRSISEESWETVARISVNQQSVLLKQKSASNYLSISYHILRVDDLVFVTVPGEITSDLTKDLRENLGVFILSYCNGYEFYFADEACYRNETYEAQHSFLAPFEAEKWVEQVAEQLK